MELSYEYQLALAEYWEGRATMEPNVWVPGLPLQMTVAAPASSNTDLVVSSSKGPQLVDESSYDQCVVHIFNQAAQSLDHTVDRMKEKIHLFPPSMGDLKSYSAPKVVSIGPYHHGTPALLQMESIKVAAAGHFVNESDSTILEVYGAIHEVAAEARGYYDEEKLQSRGCGGGDDDQFKPIMFLDGCFLLQYMLFKCRQGQEDKDLAENMDPSLYNAFSSVERPIFNDVVLLENQLPWVVIKALMRFMPTKPELGTLIGRVKWTLQSRQGLEFITPKVDYDPPHLLELLRYYIVGTSSTEEAEPKSLSEKARKLSVSVSAIELAEIGINITPTTEGAELNKMQIDDSACLTAKLCLPPLSLDAANASFLVNMAALEQCATPDFINVQNEDMSAVSSYLCLLGMVTDNVDDVQELRKKRILSGGSGLTNEDTLGLLNNLEKHLRFGPHYVNTMFAIENYKVHKKPQIKFHKFHYTHRKAIFLTVSGIAGLVSFLATLKSLR